MDGKKGFGPPYYFSFVYPFALTHAKKTHSKVDGVSESAKKVIGKVVAHAPITTGARCSRAVSGGDCHLVDLKHLLPLAFSKLRVWSMAT
jgi:hypothetical protein